MTPLHMSSSKGHVEVARVLFKHVADATTHQDGSTLPDLASTKEPAFMLLERGASATAQDQEGLTPVYRTSSRGEVEVAWRFSRAARMQQLRTNLGSTTLHVAWHRPGKRRSCANGNHSRPRRTHGSAGKGQANSFASLEFACVLLGRGADPIFYKSGAGFARKHLETQHVTTPSD